MRNISKRLVRVGGLRSKAACPQLQNEQDCLQNQICAWNSKTKKCSKKRVSKIKEAAHPQIPQFAVLNKKRAECFQLKKQQDCLQNQICSWSSKTNKCAKKRGSKVPAATGIALAAPVPGLAVSNQLTPVSTGSIEAIVSPDKFNIPNKTKITKRYQNVIRQILRNGLTMQYKRNGSQIISNPDKDQFVLTKAEPIGVGGFGVVLKGLYKKKNVVVKFINFTKPNPVETIPELPADASVVNIIGYSKYYDDEKKYDFIKNRADDTVVIFMEALSGGTLKQVIIRCKENPKIIQKYGGLEHLVAKIGIDISNIFDSIHKTKMNLRQLMYSDIKPDNILFNSIYEPILIDFDGFLSQSNEGALGFGTRGFIPLCKYKSKPCLGQNATDDYEMLIITLLDVAMLNVDTTNRQNLLVINSDDSKLVRDLKSLLIQLQTRDRKVEIVSPYSQKLKDLLHPYLKKK